MGFRLRGGSFFYRSISNSRRCKVSKFFEGGNDKIMEEAESSMGVTPMLKTMIYFHDYKSLFYS